MTTRAVNMAECVRSATAVNAELRYTVVCTRYGSKTTSHITMLDNGHGRINGGEGPFWINEGCPLHSPPQTANNSMGSD